MLKKFILVTIILMSVYYCRAQDENSKQTKIDTVYIKDLSDKLSIRIFGVNKFTRFDIKDNEIDSLVSYSPNRNLNLGFGLNYKWFGLGVAFNFPFINNDDDIYGKTKRFDAHTNIFTRNLAIDFYLSSYRGFYIENPDSYLPDWTPGMPYPQRPDISTIKLAVVAFMLLNTENILPKLRLFKPIYKRKVQVHFYWVAFSPYLEL